MNQPIIIFSRHNAPTSAAVNFEAELLALLQSNNLNLLLIPHLYHITENSPALRAIRDNSPSAILLLSWLHPRPAQWILQSHGINVTHLTFHNLASFPSPQAVLDTILSSLPKSKNPTSPGNVTEITEPTSPRWYPVVDQSRCINCGHCLQFCLFGVYTLNPQGHLTVQNPDQCKPGCPACSRICPQGAIIFPLYDKNAAIAGAPDQFMTLDPAARRMFYTRTKKTCPLCNSTHTTPGAERSDAPVLCPECGRPLPQPSNNTPPAPPPFDDLDALVDQLDRTMQKKP